MTFYNIGALFMGLGRAKIRCHQCHLLGRFYYCKSGAIIAWWLFRKCQISRSVNIEAKKTLTHALDQQRLNQLLVRAKRQASPAVVFDTNKLTHRKIDLGVCHGASMHFVKKFLKIQAQDYSLREAFKLAAKSFSKGISEKTCLKQYLDNCMAVNVKKASIEEKERKAHFERITIQAFANLFKVAIKRSQTHITARNGTFEIPHSLPNDCYLVELSSAKRRISHMVALIKTADQFLIYDPNFGAAVLKNSAIFNKMQKLYQNDALDFYPMGLAR
jgi:hypothetical protein